MFGSLLCLLCVGAAMAGEPATSECGRQSAPSTQVVKGETVVAGQLPWLVNIYGAGRTDGTLISPTHVVTTAFYVCVDQSNTPKPASSFSLTAAQFVWHSTPAEEPHSQTRGVRSVLIHPQFTGKLGTGHDIALLVTNASFDITPAVNVACVDWSGLLQAPTTSDVIIVSSYKHGAINKHRLVTATQLYTPVARQHCRERARSERRSWLTDDVFCAEPASNATCNDHSGAGLLVERDISGRRRYYLAGVHNVDFAFTYSVHCYYDRLNGFTDVKQHISWLRQHVSPPT